MLAINTTGVMTALPAMQTDLSLSPLMARWAVNGYIATSSLLIMLGGVLGDRHGHFRLVFYGITLFTVTSVLVALAQNGLMLVISRVIQGGAAALIVALSLSSLSIAFLRQQRALAMSLWGGITALGFGLGPLLAGYLTTVYSWRYLFMLTAMITGLGSFANFIFYRYYPKVIKPTSIDWIGIFLLMGWIGPLIFWLMSGEGVMALLLPLMSLGFLVLFAVRIVTSSNALINKQLLKNKQLIGSCLVFFATTFSLINFLFFYNRFMQWPLLHNYSALEAGLLVLPANVVMFIAAAFSSKFGHKVGFRMVLAVGLMLMVVGFLSFSQFPLSSMSWYFLLPLCLLGVGFGFTFPVVPHVGLSSLPDELQGKGAGILNTVNYLGGSLAIALGSMVYLKFGSKSLHGMNRQAVDEILLGSRDQIFSWQTSAPSLEVLQNAVMTSFIFTMLFAAIASASGFLATSLITRKKN